MLPILSVVGRLCVIRLSVAVLDTLVNRAKTDELIKILLMGRNQGTTN